MGEGGLKVHISSYQMSQSWRCRVKRGDYSERYCTVYLKVAKRVDLKSSHRRENIVNYLW